MSRKRHELALRMKNVAALVTVKIYGDNMNYFLRLSQSIKDVPQPLHCASSVSLSFRHVIQGCTIGYFVGYCRCFFLASDIDTNYQFFRSSSKSSQHVANIFKLQGRVILSRCFCSPLDLFYSCLRSNFWHDSVSDPLSIVAFGRIMWSRC